MEDKDLNLGELVSMEDTAMAQDIPEESSRRDTETGNILWSYQQEGRINGVPVAPEDANLKINTDDLVTSAFVLARSPKSIIMRMSPENTETQNMYNDILRRAYDGEVLIVDELRQFDTAKGDFILWLKYDEICYRLNPRYSYLRDE